MRFTDGLKAMDEVALLWKYLYMNEEHFIDVKNSVGIPVRITIDEKGNAWVCMMGLSTHPKHQEDIAISTWFAVVKQLKEQPVNCDFTGDTGEASFKNAWEEIAAVTEHTLALNLLR